MNRKNKAFVFSLVVLFSCQSSGPEVKHETSDPSVVFISNRDRAQREFDIYTMQVGSGEPKNLTSGLNSVTSLSEPCFLPGQKQILFFSSQGSTKELMLLNSDGSGYQSVTALNVIRPDATFSPDGKSIVFVDKSNSKRQIHTVAVNGANRSNLSNNSYDEFEPRFSPDGQRIVFTSSRGGTRSLCLMQTDGTRQTKLTGETNDEEQAVFSPNGKLIAYASASRQGSEIHILNLASRAVENLTDNKAFNANPVFTPDGAKVVFISSIRGVKFRDILVKELGTGKIHNLTSGLNFINQHFRLSADGMKIIFESINASNAEVYMVDIDGQNLINLTNHPNWDGSPSF